MSRASSCSVSSCWGGVLVGRATVWLEGVEGCLQGSSLCDRAALWRVVFGEPRGGGGWGTLLEYSLLGVRFSVEALIRWATVVVGDSNPSSFDSASNIESSDSWALSGAGASPLCASWRRFKDERAGSVESTSVVSGGFFLSGHVKAFLFQVSVVLWIGS